MFPLFSYNVPILLLTSGLLGWIFMDFLTSSSFHLPCFLFLKSQPDYLELYDFDSSIFCKYVLLFQIRFLHELQCHSFFILKFFFLDRLINLLLMFNFLFLYPLDFFDRISYYFLFLMLIFFFNISYQGLLWKR